jgi:hypothetical protein
MPLFDPFSVSVAAQVITAGGPPYAELPACIAVPLAILFLIIFSRAGMRDWTGKRH